jgi:hypothetical protein
MISLIHPSRGRAQKSFDTIDRWKSMSGTDDLEVLVSLDKDDPLAIKYYGAYDKFNHPIHRVSIKERDNRSLVEATNHASKEAKGDILVYLSDDFKCPDNWGQLVLKEFEGVTTPRILKIDDKLQDFRVRVLTMPIMNRAAYEQLGYFFNPLYKSMWVDCDLYETAHRRGWIKPCPHLVFPHEHVSNGMAPDDDTYRRSAANWDQGKAVFEQRKSIRFV